MRSEASAEVLKDEIVCSTGYSDAPILIRAPVVIRVALSISCIE